METHTRNPLFGDTWNPWDTSLTSGGSTGGDSAAVASGMSAFGLGTDFGGSIRWPAHCTGIASLRPTPGLVPGDRAPALRSAGGRQPSRPELDVRPAPAGHRGLAGPQRG